MRYFFAINKSGKLLEVKHYSKMFCVNGIMFLDGIEYMVDNISVDLLNNKTHVYVTLVKE